MRNRWTISLVLACLAWLGGTGLVPCVTMARAAAAATPVATVARCSHCPSRQSAPKPEPSQPCPHCHTLDLSRAPQHDRPDLMPMALLATLDLTFFCGPIGELSPLIISRPAPSGSLLHSVCRLTI